VIYGWFVNDVHFHPFYDDIFFRSYIYFFHFFFIFFFIFFKCSWVLIVDYIHAYTYSYFISIKIHNSISFNHCSPLWPRLTIILFSGLMSSDFLQDLICSCKGRKICSRECACYEQNLCCGMRTREQSLLVASLTRRLFGLVWQDLYFAVGSYNFATTFLATHIEDSRSGSTKHHHQ
jgi:hypothetical protein